MASSMAEVPVFSEVEHENPDGRLTKMPRMLRLG